MKPNKNKPTTRNAPRIERTAQREDSREEKLAKLRKTRTKVKAGFRSKMSVPDSVKEPGFEHRWVNDDKNNIPEKLDRGWEYVPKNDKQIGDDISGGNRSTGNNIGIYVGKKADGQPMFAYLMRIYTELYEEDYATKQAGIDKTEAQITGKSKTKEEAKAEGSTEYGNANIKHNLSA